LRFQHVEEGFRPISHPPLAAATRHEVRWAGDPREQLAALAVCAALADKFGAIVHEPEGDRLLTLDELLEKARKASDSL